MLSKSVIVPTPNLVSYFHADREEPHKITDLPHGILVDDAISPVGVIVGVDI